MKEKKQKLITLYLIIRQVISVVWNYRPDFWENFSQKKSRHILLLR
jgi:hypothetical protein